MEERYLSYLSLLEELSGVLETLSGLARQKIDAVRADDLAALDKVLKQEQALALDLRGLEQKRAKQLEALGLTQTTLNQLPDAYPEALRMRARETVMRLRTQYDLYHGMAEAARNTLESNLHEVEKILTALGDDSVTGPGYAPSNAEPPSAMKTDFRA